MSEKRLSEKRLSKKSKAGSVKQKPLVECKAVQLGKWVLGNELNQSVLSLIRTHIESTVGSHRQDSVTKTRLRFFERGLASGDKPSILSFGLEQFYPIEDIKQLMRDEKHTNVVFCIIKSPSLVYEVVAFRCPTEYEAQKFAEHFKRVKDQSGTGFNIDLKDPPDGQETNWSMKTTTTRHMSDVNAMQQVNGNAYESVTMTETGGAISTHVDKNTKTLHITTSGMQDDDETYAVVDMSQKRAAREAAEARAAQSTTTTTVTKEAVVLPSQQTTTVVEGSVGAPVVFDVNIPNQQTTVVREVQNVVPAQTQQQTVVREVHNVVPAQTQQQTVVREYQNVIPAQTQQQTVVREVHNVVPAQTQQQTVVREVHNVVPAQTQQQTVVREYQNVVPAQTQQQTVVREYQNVVPAQTQQQTVVREYQNIVPAQTQQQTRVVKEVHNVVPQPTQQQTTVTKEVHNVVPAQTQQQTVVREVHNVVPAQTQQQTTVTKNSLIVPGQQKSHKVVKQVQSAPPATKIVKETSTAPRQQQQTQVIKEVHTVPTNSRMVTEVEYNEVAVLNARIISLEQENKYLRELLKRYSGTDKDLEVFMSKETVTNGPLVDSVVITDGDHHAHQTMKYSRQGQAAVTVGDYRTGMVRAESDRSIGSFVKVRKHRGVAGKHAMEDYNGGSLRSQQSGSLYASSIRGGNIYAEGQNIYAQTRHHGLQHGRHTALNLHHHSRHGDIITQTMASPNSGLLVVPQGTFKKSSKHGPLYIERPIERVYDHPVYADVDVADGSISISDDDEDQVFEVDSPMPVKLV